MADRWDLPPFASGQDQLFNWTLTSSPSDITSQMLILSVRKRYTSPVLFTLTLADGGLTVTNAAQGKMNVFFASAKTKGLAPGGYVYDLWRMDPNNTRRLTWGTLIFDPAVTLVP